MREEERKDIGTLVLCNISEGEQDSHYGLSISKIYKQLVEDTRHFESLALEC